MKVIVVGGFDYAIKWEMNADALVRYIDSFIDFGNFFSGETYLGKPVRKCDYIDKINLQEYFFVIGSIVYHTEIKRFLEEKGLVEGTNFRWAIEYVCDENGERLWHHTEWDSKENSANRHTIEEGGYAEERLAFISQDIDEECTTVIDLCAANGRMRKYLKDTVQYFPVDYIRYGEDTVVYDLNKDAFPNFKNDPKKTTVLLIASIQFANDWKGLLKEIASVCDTFICANNEFISVNRDYRREHFCWNRVVFNTDIVMEMQKLGFVLSDAYDYRLRVCVMKFRRADI